MSLVNINSKVIKVAIVGAGFMAKEHIRAFKDIPAVSIVGIYSRTLERARRLADTYRIPHVFGSLESLYDGTQAHLVIVAVPELMTKQVCMSIFRFPWQALIEKPLGYNLAEACEIAEVANKSRTKVYVGLNRRHYSSTRAVLREVSEVHGPRLICVYDQEDPIIAFARGRPQEVVDNWMYANSIHLIDYFRLFCRGDVVSVNHLIPWNPVSPRFVVAKLDFSSGDSGIYQAIWNGPGPWGVTISTQKIRWELRPLEKAFRQSHTSRIAEEIPPDTEDIKFKAGLFRQAEECIKAVCGEPNTMPVLSECLETTKLVGKIYEA